MHIENEISVAAPVATLWELTERIEHWPSLSSNFDEIQRLDGGPLKVGSRARVTQPNLGSRVWTVTRLEPNTAFVWETRMFGVRMIATHLLAPEPGGCRSTLALTLSGIGAGLLGRLGGTRMRAAVEKENADLAAAAERRASR